MTAPNPLKSETIHLRVPTPELTQIKRLALSAGLPTATQARLLIREALQARKLIK